LPFSIEKTLRRFRTESVSEFYLHIQPLLDHGQVQALADYTQHNCYSRLSHSLDVAYYSFVVAKLFGWDRVSAARGGLLHDLYLYEGRGKGHMRGHAQIALENAKQICALNKVEENIIKRHMWLCTLIPPRYKEGFVVTFVDKYCAVREALIGLKNRKWESIAGRRKVEIGETLTATT